MPSHCVSICKREGGEWIFLLPSVSLSLLSPLQSGVCVDLSKINSIVEVHTEDFYASVQPGVTRKTLNNYLRDTGLWFPIGMLINCPTF